MSYADELIAALRNIANLWPLQTTADILSVSGINDGRSRAIIAESAVTIARTVLSKAAYTNVISQGDILADGSTVAVVVSPEDVMGVCRDNFQRECTLAQASEFISDNSGDIVDAMVEGWSEVLYNLSALESFADELPASPTGDRDAEEV